MRTVLLLLLALSFLPAQAAEKTTEQHHPHRQHRIIALSPHLTEMVATAGGLDQLVGVVSYSDYPQAAQKLPLVGSYNAINFEAILQLQPDIILAWQGGNRNQDIIRLKQLSQQLGFKLFLSHPQKLQDIPQEIKAIGKLIGTEKTAQVHAQTLLQILNTQQQRYAKVPWVTAFYEIWHHPLMTINGQHFISQAMAVCHAKNSFADLKPIAGEVSIEAVIQRNPDIILLGGDQQKQQRWLTDWQRRYPIIKAVKQHHLIPLNADLYQRPTARLIQALPQLCQKIDLTR